MIGIRLKRTAGTMNLLVYKQDTTKYSIQKYLCEHLLC